MIMNNSISYAYFPSNKYAKNSEKAKKIIILKQEYGNYFSKFMKINQNLELNEVFAFSISYNVVWGRKKLIMWFGEEKKFRIY